jgi:hypothetical protein
MREHALVWDSFSRIRHVAMAIAILGAGGSLQAQTLVDRNGNMLRGVPMVVGKALPASTSYSQDVANWTTARDNYGINTVRLCWVDPWYRSNGYDYWTVDQALPEIDKCVAAANAAGMNVVINYHSVGEWGNGNRDFSFLSEFWRKIATRYRNNSLVFYEIANEPTFQNSDYYDASFKDAMLAAYDQVRRDAPNRQILMFSFNSYGLDMAGIVGNYSSRIQWSRTSVAFHLYGTNGTGDALRQLQNNYRIVCTEWDYPGRFDYVPRVDDKDISAETCEAIGCSWMDWRDWTDNTYTRLDQRLLPDARAKQYWWGSSGGPPPSLRAGTYRITATNGTNVLSGRDVAWTPALEAPLNTTWTSQQWYLERVAGERYRLRCIWFGYYLHGNQTQWADVTVGTSDPSWTSQTWTIEKVGTSGYRLKCDWGGNYLTNRNQAWTALRNAPLNTSWTAQLWKLRRL